jgi:hypothetical protein
MWWLKKSKNIKFFPIWILFLPFGEVSKKEKKEERLWGDCEHGKMDQM